MSRRCKFRLTLACLMQIVLALTETLTAYVMAMIVACAERGDMDALVRTLLTAILLILLMYLLAAVDVTSQMAFLSDGVLEMRGGIMRSLLRRALPDFRRKSDAYYMNLLGADIDIYRAERLGLIPYIFGSVSAILSAAVMLYLLNPWLLLAGMALSVLPLATSSLFTKSTQRWKTKVSQTSEAYTNTVKEGVEGYEAIRMGGGQRAYLERFQAAGLDKQRAYSRSNFINKMSFRTLYLVASVLQVACLGIGGYLAVRGQMSAAMLFAAINYFTSISNGLTNMMDYIINIRSTKEVTKKLNSERDKPAPPESAPIRETAPAVEYEDVSFSFGERQLYSQFTYRFAPGGCYAVVGESGSGKSTLMKLLLKYYDEYSGAIRLAGQDIRSLSEDAIYGAVGMVGQSPFLFNAPLYENITLFTGVPARDSEEYRALLERLNLTALAQRVGDAPLGDFGDNISGGERQRISIARAMRVHPSIMVFDEPTTGLDPENVELIENFIFRQGDMTRIVITHNWSEAYLRRFDDVIRIGDPPEELAQRTVPAL